MARRDPLAVLLSRPWFASLVLMALAALGSPALASEADLVVPNLNSVKFFGIGGATLLSLGMLVGLAGLAFGFVYYRQLRDMPVHSAMRDVSELIYSTCKAYLAQQARFLALLWVFIIVVIAVYFGLLRHMNIVGVSLIVLFSLVGIAGSYAVAAFGMRINCFANSRTAMSSLTGRPYPVYAIPLNAGMSVGMVLISVELLIMLMILLLVPGNLAGPCFVGFAIGESLGAAALRVAGGIFTKIADIGADLMKIVFKIKEDDARNPGVIADCVGDNAGDSVGPTADGFETYGVTGVALISFILLAIRDTAAPEKAIEIQVQLLVWIFVMRLMMVLVSGLAYFINEAMAKMRYEYTDRMHFEGPLTELVWITSILSIVATYAVSLAMIGNMGDGTAWWKLATIISCGTLAGAVIPEVTKIFTSTTAKHTREVVTSSRQGGASLNVLSGLVAGNFSAFWLAGMVIAGLMGVAYLVSTQGLGQLIDPQRPEIAGQMAAVFAFGLVAFGFLGMGPVTIAVDSYGPVTDNAQSVYELSLIENVPNIQQDISTNFGFDPQFERAKQLLEENDGAGNTFKATAKPVLIGTAVVGATTMIFSIIMVLTNGLTDQASIAKLSILHAPFLLGLILGGAVIYWFTGASTQAVVAGAYRAVEFIKANIKLEGVEKASEEDSRKVVQICTRYAQAGMFNIFLTVFFMTLALACLDAYLFIGYLISLAIFGLFQAVFMANAGGAWDNAKKIVETELREKGSDLHAATVVGDTVGDPFKDTSSVAMNPIIKFTTLFGLLALELAIEINHTHREVTLSLAGLFFVIALIFIHRSFYGMRIGDDRTQA